MANVPIPWFQLLMITVFVRKEATCTEGWINASQIRRMVTQLWGTCYIMQNALQSNRDGYHVGFTSADLFPNGSENLTREDMARRNALVGEWFDYWSERYPTDTLSDAVVNMLGRILKIKRMWDDLDNGQPFSFDLALAQVRLPRFDGLRG